MAVENRGGGSVGSWSIVDSFGNVIKLLQPGEAITITIGTKIVIHQTDSHDEWRFFNNQSLGVIL